MLIMSDVILEKFVFVARYVLASNHHRWDDGLMPSSFFSFVVYAQLICQPFYVPEDLIYRTNLLKQS